MKKTFKKLMAMGIIASSICILPLTGANAEWKQDSHGWWNSEGNTWSVGWKEIDGKWYYFGQDGYMAHDTIIDGKYKLDNNGVWVQNTTVNSNNTTTTSTNIDTTSNSNNMTNLTNNVDNSTKVSKDVTLNNTGSITNNTTNNNYDINIAKNDDSIAKQLEKSREESNEKLRLSYEASLKEYKVKLADAKTQLEKAKNQKSVKTYTQLDDGTWGFVYKADEKAIERCQKDVDFYENLVEKYEALLK